MIKRLIVDSFTVSPLTGSHSRTAAKFVDQHTLGLRTGDALHLAIAAEHGSTVQTLDQRLAEAGPVLGVMTKLLVQVVGRNAPPSHYAADYASLFRPTCFHEKMRSSRASS